MKQRIIGALAPHQMAPVIAALFPELMTTHQ
jgi:hypothetical protein